MDADFQKEVIDRSIDDIKRELDREFKENFRRKAFFDEQQWPEAKHDDGTGALMLRKGTLRNSLHSHKRRGELVYTSAVPYARIHNEGGEIKVTRKMKGHFFGELKETRGKFSYKKDGELRNTKRNRQLTEDEQFYLAMALKKVGSSIVIPERRFIGMGRNTDRIIREVTERNLEDFFKNHKTIEK